MSDNKWWWCSISSVWTGSILEDFEQLAGCIASNPVHFDKLRNTCLLEKDSKLKLQSEQEDA